MSRVFSSRLHDIKDDSADAVVAGLARRIGSFFMFPIICSEGAYAARAANKRRPRRSSTNLAATNGATRSSERSRFGVASAFEFDCKTRRTDMSQVLEVAPAHPRPIQYAASKGADIPFLVVVAMFAVAIGLSLVSMILPGWVFQPSDLTALALP